jgi:hypothetical protein
VLLLTVYLAVACCVRLPRRTQPGNKEFPCEVRVHVTDLAKQGPQYDDVVRFLRSIASAAPCEQCARFFGGWKQVKKYIDDLLRYDLLAVGRATDLKNTKSVINAFVGTRGTDAPLGFMALFINNDGVFFNPALEIGGYRGGSSGARWLLVCHEISHALSIASSLPDLDDPAAGIFNTELVLANCHCAIHAENHH